MISDSLARSLNQEQHLDWHASVTIRIAILDMNNGLRNLGIRNIKRIIDNFTYYVRVNGYAVDFQVDHFHVRDRNEVPENGYDIYISSGGPGSPLEETATDWEEKFSTLLDQILEHNLSHENKQYFFGICHSFQLMAKKFEVGYISQRDKRNLGIVPIFRSEEGRQDYLFEGLQDKFYAFDNRDWQVTEPDAQRLKNMNARILSFEGSESHAGKAITGIRYSDEMESVQFHPEAEKSAILMRFTDPDEKSHIIEVLGDKAYEEFIQSVLNPNKLLRTYKAILPGFLRRSFNGLMNYYELPHLQKPIA